MSTVATGGLQTLDGTKELSTEGIVQGSAKAWVNFTAITTTFIRDSVNVSSITDNAIGDTAVSLTNAMANSTYAVPMGGTKNDAVNNYGHSRQATLLTANGFHALTGFVTSTHFADDHFSTYASVFGDLA